MLQTQEELLNILTQINIDHTNHEHPAVYTVEEADLQHGGIEGVHSKNLFFKDKKKNLFLVVTLSDKPIQIKEVAKKIGAKSPSFGKSDLLAQVLGVIPGAVTPFAVINAAGHPLKVILDEEMMENDLLNFHPLVNTATTTIAAKDLIKFFEHCNQEFEIIRL
ncbi:MAG: prolyl-tRNA synthetase associated domain-containing protein [Proteobacteria bacterium]|nr:prolyl-tRNA synthetase associated domain-containing protein [Pseudomonadota bacterium]MBU1581501.1 prolyl-tRNA synthetase associated domain-containing protein [Pseudomonadota bacterium]MBU2456003.1 prolyl-tRNA synthetase associated domain-containing protein [Pseudomonadota bacterium]MBU2630304.1 prolyl-tRNA synthetase associated domain-containing protein [Pseudomonadota bacterium]